MASNEDTVRAGLRRLYENNMAGAAALGAWWAVDDFRSRIDHLDTHPDGPLTDRMGRDAAYFGDLIYA